MGLVILERISSLDPSLEMIGPRYLKFSTAYSLSLFILVSLWKLFGLFVINFILSGPLSHFVSGGVISRQSASSCSVMSLICKAEVGNMPSATLTLLSWSSSAPQMILSSKILKSVGESRHLYRIPTVVLNQSPVLPMNRTALWALSYIFSMTRMMWLWCCISP